MPLWIAAPPAVNGKPPETLSLSESEGFLAVSITFTTPHLGHLIRFCEAEDASRGKPQLLHLMTLSDMSFQNGNHSGKALMLRSRKGHKCLGKNLRTFANGRPNPAFEAVLVQETLFRSPEVLFAKRLSTESFFADTGKRFCYAPFSARQFSHWLFWICQKCF